ncbi:hypothetical protein D3C84_971130 [compost metagenome]
MPDRDAKLSDVPGLSPFESSLCDSSDRKATREACQGFTGGLSTVNTGPALS